MNVTLLESQGASAPRAIATARFGYIASRAIGVAVELDLFSHIDAGADTIEKLAQAAGASPRGIRLLIDAMAVQGLVHRFHGKLALPNESRQHLVKGRAGYIGGMILHADAHWSRWTKLTEAVVGGTAPQRAVESDADDGKYFAPLIAGLHQLNLPASQALAADLKGKVLRVLDLGAGSGVWSLPHAQSSDQVQVVAVDREEVLQTTRDYARQAGCYAQYLFRAGNLRDVPWDIEADEGYDLVLLGHVLHSEGLERSRTLLRRAHNALKPGGQVMIAEMIPDENRCHDLYGVLFGLQMLMMTEEGDVFTASELEHLVAEAGFTTHRWLDTPALYPLLLAGRSR